jgi:hypothetical protein
MLTLQGLTIFSGYIIAVLIALLGFVVIWRILDGTIDLSQVISEPNGGASMSRFQFLVFTFVIALSLFLVIIGNSKGIQFPEKIPAEILTLLGISGTSYLVSKGIQFSDPTGIADRGTDIIISPMKANVPPGQTKQFSAEVPGKPGSGVKWEVIAGPGTISADGLYTAPPAAAVTPGSPPATAAPHLHATVQVTSDEFPNSYDVAVVTIV